MTIVQNVVGGTNGTPIAGTTVNITLVSPSGGFTVTGTQLPSTYTATTGADGTWSLDLTPNASIAGDSYYNVSEPALGRTTAFLVPTTGGSVTLSAIKIPAPAGDSSAMTAANDIDDLSGYYTKSQTDTAISTQVTGRAMAVHTHAETDVTNLAADLANKIATSQLGVANGVASLDSGAHIPVGQIPDLSTNYVRVDALTYNFKDHGGKVDGATDDSAALASLISTVNAAGGGIIRIPAGTCLLANPVTGASKVWIRGDGTGITTLKGAASFPLPANMASGQGTGLIQYVGTFGSSATSQPIFQNVAITDMTLDMTAVNDANVNVMNGIFQDYSQLRHARFERLSYLGLTKGQGILLQGLGRITGSWSRDITIRDIQAINGAGTVSTYLNAVNDSTATYSGVTIENIYSYVGGVSNIVDDRVVVVASQGGGAQTTPARIRDIRVHGIYTEMDQAGTTTGTVNGVKLDTGTWGLIEHVTVRDVFFMGDGSSASQTPFIVLTGANGYIQDYLVDGVYGYRCGAVRCRFTRYDNAPSVIVRNIVLLQSNEPNGLVQVYTASGAVGDELISFDSINVHSTTNTGSAIMLEGGTSAQGASGAINIRGLVAKGTAIGVSTNKTDSGATLQSGYNNIHISDSNLSGVTTPFSGTGTYTAVNVTGMPNNVSGPLSYQASTRKWNSGTLTPSATANTAGASQTVTPSAGQLGFSSVTLARAVFGGTFGAETATCTFTATFSDTTTAVATAAATATGTQVLGSSGLLSLAKDGLYITSITVNMQSTIASSAVTCSVDVIAAQN